MCKGTGGMGRCGDFMKQESLIIQLGHTEHKEDIQQVDPTKSNWTDWGFKCRTIRGTKVHGMSQWKKKKKTNNRKDHMENQEQRQG